MFMHLSPLCFSLVALNTALHLRVPVSAEPDNGVLAKANYEKGDYLPFEMENSMKICNRDI